MRTPIEYVDEPRLFRLPEMPIFKPKSVAGIFLVLTGPRIDGLITHWNGARDVAHTVAPCSGCQKGQSVRWSGYVSACCLDEGEHSDRPGGHGFFELTEAAFEQVKKLLGGRTMYRGLALHVRRKDSRRNSKLLVREIQLPQSLELPPHLDGKGFIRRLYSVPFLPEHQSPAPPSRGG